MPDNFKKWIPFAGVLGFLAILVFWSTGVNNQLVRSDEEVNEKKSQVENVYQRRMDLIPNLVATVKGYAKHEAEVLEEVTKARSQVGQMKINGPEDLKNFEGAQSGLTSALSRLMIVAEKYPELKADKGFLELQSQLEGTENRIAVERKNYNEAVKIYNSYLRVFPQSFIASFRGFKERPYFQSDAGAKTAPKVQF